MSAFRFKAAVLVACAASGCGEDLGMRTQGLQSLAVTLVTPAPGQLGSPSAPVTTLSKVTISLEAIGPDGQRYVAEPDLAVDVFLSYSGNKVGRISACGKGDDTIPLTTIHLVDGALPKPVDVPLIRAFGKANVWFEEHNSLAVGATPDIYFPEFSLTDLNAPLDPTSPTAAYCSPWTGRYVRVDHPSGDGKLIVSSVFGNAFVVTDTSSNALFDSKTLMGGYNSLYVFSFGRPPRQAEVGRVVLDVSGNFSKFNGFSELNFPIQDFDTAKIAPPPPIVLDANTDTTTELAALLPLSASVVQITGVMCPIDPTLDSWKKYNQFTLQDTALAMNCSTFGSFAVEMPGKTLGTFDPLMAMGKTVTITGMLRNNSGQNDACKGHPIDCVTAADCTTASLNSMNMMYNDPADSKTCPQRLSGAACVEGTCRRGAFNFWTVVPRNAADIVVN